MTEAYTPLQAAELSAEENANVIDGVLNNLPPCPSPEEKPPDRVKEPPHPSRSREREER